MHALDLSRVEPTHAASRGRRLGLTGILLATLLAACSDFRGDAGADGSPGHTTLVRTTQEPAGEHCPAGGLRVDAGLDLDRDGVL